MERFTVYCDGSGTTGGPAGIAYVALNEDGTVYHERALPVENATNQQAEILAAAYALHTLPAGSDITIRSDSQYVVKGWNEWLPDWIAGGWRKRSGGAPSNKAHWQRLVKARERQLKVRFEWLRGHDGDKWNERADVLAKEARAMLLREEAA